MTSGARSPVGNFDTARLSVRSWVPVLSDPAMRRGLAVALAAVLTPPVLKYVPETLHLAPGPDAVENWIVARAADSQVYTVSLRADGRLAGLLIVAVPPEPGTPPTHHIGYLLAEPAWGQGHATELLRGLVEAARSGGVSLVAGTDIANPASARVLEKAGFVTDTARSTAETVVFRRNAT